MQPVSQIARLLAVTQVVLEPLPYSVATLKVPPMYSRPLPSYSMAFTGPLTPL